MCTTYGEDDASNRIVVCNGEKFGNLEDRKRVCRRFSKIKVKNSPETERWQKIVEYNDQCIA